MGNVSKYKLACFLLKLNLTVSGFNRKIHRVVYRFINKINPFKYFGNLYWSLVRYLAKDNKKEFKLIVEKELDKAYPLAKNNKPYLLFCYNEYYPAGGMNDCKGQFRTLEEAREEMKKHKTDYSEIIDKETMKSLK